MATGGATPVERGRPVQDGLIVSKRMDIVVGLDAQRGKGNANRICLMLPIMCCLVEAELPSHQKAWQCHEQC